MAMSHMTLLFVHSVTIQINDYAKTMLIYACSCTCCHWGSCFVLGVLWTGTVTWRGTGVGWVPGQGARQVSSPCSGSLPANRSLTHHHGPRYPSAPYSSKYTPRPGLRGADGVCSLCPNIWPSITWAQVFNSWGIKWFFLICFLCICSIL